MSELAEKSIVLGVTGGIAAYKAATIASLLMQAGALVDVVMSEGAQRFIQPLTFSAITHRPVHMDRFAPWHEDFSGHVGLGTGADLLIVAPATAASMARLALGTADDLIGLIALSSDAPIIIAPAMEDRMFQHPATREHLTTLVQRGAHIVGPEHGRLASGAVGEGRLADPELIVAAAGDILRRSTRLSGRQVVVTAGGTREPLDPIRYIGNRSSGMMGYSLATASIAAGAVVTLISGPTNLHPPVGAVFVTVETASEMHRAVEKATRSADVLIMAAAVADFRPETTSDRKLKKQDDQEYFDLRLVRNPDILASIERPGLLKIGFAAETEDLLKNAANKLASKQLAMIVANDAPSTIGARTSAATILTSDGSVTALPEMTKDTLSAEIVRIVAELLDGSGRHGS